MIITVVTLLAVRHTDIPALGGNACSNTDHHREHSMYHCIRRMCMYLA